jgi:hypothetical protein
MFETFNVAVDPVAGSWERETRSYEHDGMLLKFLDATPQQVQRMWDRFDREVDVCHPEDNIRDIRSINNKEHNRLSLFREDVEKLANGVWLANSVIDFFHWKLIDVFSASSE